ncbi:MAG: hypothetical protein EAX81_08620 [Candidatus Thorarchaeota archaeon]|nr:hypothetical protein [Candidatus Thorarchaeota archaeon]
MTRLMSERLTRTLTDFHKDVKQVISDEYNLDPEKIGKFDLLSFQNYLDERLEEADQLSFHAPLEESLPFARGILAKWCFQQVLDFKSICSECIDDLSNEFARLMLEPSERSAWVEYWRLVSPRRKVSSVLVYNPSIRFPSLADMVGDRGFKTIIHELCMLSKNDISLSLDDYLAFLRDRIRRFSLPLNSTELKIVRKLVIEGDFSHERLAKDLGISSQWLSRRLTALKKRNILRRFDRAPFSRIGIRMYHFYVRNIDAVDDPYKLLSKCPFLYTYQSVLTGLWTAYAVFCVPDNHQSIRTLSVAQTAFEKWGFSTMLVEVASSGFSYSFDFYDCEAGEWRMPWEILAVELTRVLNNRLADIIPRVDHPANRTSLSLDQLDMSIIEQVYRGNTSIQGIRSALRVGQQRVNDRMRRLRKDGIIATKWEAHNIGLYENIVIVCDDLDVGEAVAAWARRVPEAIVSFDLNRRLSLLVRLPCGGSYGLAQSIGQVTDAASIGLLGPRIYGAWGLPIDLWDANVQKWLSPTAQVNQWLDSLR